MTFNLTVSLPSFLVSRKPLPPIPREEKTVSRKNRQQQPKRLRDAEINTLSLLPQRRHRPPPVPKGTEDDEDEDEDDEDEEVVVALYDFEGLEPHDLKLVRGGEYVILDKCDVNWYKARNQYG